jgi:hypothetical protein
VLLPNSRCMRERTMQLLGILLARSIHQ